MTIWAYLAIALAVAVVLPVSYFVLRWRAWRALHPKSCPKCRGTHLIGPQFMLDRNTHAEYLHWECRLRDSDGNCVGCGASWNESCLDAEEREMERLVEEELGPAAERMKVLGVGVRRR